ncbi:MAG: hypothetical protein ACU83N_10005 [Gammaproteobacteria bacterium]
MIFDSPLTNSVPISDLATQADVTITALLMDKMRVMLEAIFQGIYGIFESSTLTSDPPNDTTGYAYDTAAGFLTDEHNDRIIIFTSGVALGQDFIIDDTIASSRVECAGDNLYAAGARSGDHYIIVGNWRNITTGHNHDGSNSAPAVISLENIEDYIAGDYVLVSGTSDNISSASNDKLIEFKATRKGTIRTRLGLVLNNNGGSGTATGRVYVNGSAVGTIRTNVLYTWAYYNEDITINAGDLIQLYGYFTGSTDTASFYFGIMADNPGFLGRNYQY